MVEIQLIKLSNVHNTTRLAFFGDGLVILILVLIAIVKYIIKFNYEALGHVDHIPKHPHKYRFYLLGLAIYVPLTEFILEIYKVRVQSELISNIIFGIVELGQFF
jgi:hypothetical protein